MNLTGRVFSQLTFFAAQKTLFDPAINGQQSCPFNRAGKGVSNANRPCESERSPLRRAHSGSVQIPSCGGVGFRPRLTALGHIKKLTLVRAEILVTLKVQKLTGPVASCNGARSF